MARAKLDNLLGKQLTWKGKFNLGKKFIPEILCTNRKHNFMLDVSGIRTQVTLIAKGISKEILLTADENIEYEKLAELLFDLLRYENLFDGRFYCTDVLFFDGADIMPCIVQEWLPYYHSTKEYTYICLGYDSDDEYKELFLKWIDICEELDIIHQMFLYSSYASDITPDVKLALLLQTFEPIADILHHKGIITLVKQPYIIKTASCSCGNEVSVNVKNKELHFSDRLQAIIEKYGSGIFDNDNVEMLIEKAINLRNKVIHLDINHSNVLSGKESGVYIYKFSLLYRNIILSQMGLGSSGYNSIIESWVKEFDKQFDYCMIR